MNGTIDVHCHNVLPEFVRSLERRGALLDEGFPLPQWDADSHEEFMDAAEIAVSVLTMPAPHPYFGDAAECAATIRAYNEQTSQIAKSRGGRFAFCAALPLPDVSLAIREAERAFDSLGASGVKLASNTRGQYLGSEELDPLMEVLNERGAVVIMHPHKAFPANDAMAARIPLALYEYPAETTRAVLNMISRNVPARFPRIKWIVPHCASFLPLAIPRFKAIHRGLALKKMMPEIDWEKNLSNVYYDLAGAPSLGVIKSALAISSPERILYGSDFPYQNAEALRENLATLRENLRGDETLKNYEEMFLHENAEKLFGFKAKQDVCKRR